MRKKLVVLFAAVTLVRLSMLLATCERVVENEVAEIAIVDEVRVDSIRSASTVIDELSPTAVIIGADLARLSDRQKRWFLAQTEEERGHVRDICIGRSADPCGFLLQRDWRQVAALTPGARNRIDNFCIEASGPVDWGMCGTPLVLAFDAQPIAFTQARGQFAFRETPMTTDWPTAVTPWLALDRDGDGAITSGAELFGDGVPGASNGFEALAPLDDNRDGVIDRDDRAFASLLLWADANHDRTSSPDELRPASDVVVSIPLAHHRDVRCTNGNCEGERSSLTWRDADGTTRTGAVVDVYLSERRR